MPSFHVFYLSESQCCVRPCLCSLWDPSISSNCLCFPCPAGPSDCHLLSGPRCASTPACIPCSCMSLWDSWLSLTIWISLCLWSPCVTCSYTCPSEYSGSPLIYFRNPIFPRCLVFISQPLDSASHRDEMFPLLRNRKEACILQTFRM